MSRDLDDDRAYDRQHDIDDQDDRFATREAWCADCQKLVMTRMVDDGIGPYECHGATGVHSDWIEVCRLCEGQDLSDEQPEPQETDE